MNEEITYPITDISDLNQDSIEQLGTKEKFWYVKDNQNYLFKSIQVTKNGNTHLRIGEDCSEKIACEIAKILSIPHVHYDLAIYKNLRGVISKNFISVDKGESLVSGNELLERFSVTVVHQTIRRVHTIMKKLIGKKPLGFNELPDVKSAGEFFVGYLMLDALISNQDRHNENWGMIQKVNGDRHLALTFDHGASLGKNIDDEEKYERINTKDENRSVKKYTYRAKSWFYLKQDKNTRLKVMDAFKEFGLLYPKAYKAWVFRLRDTKDTEFEKIINKIPDHLMSDVSKKFALMMIKCNKDTIIANFQSTEPLNILKSE